MSVAWLKLPGFLLKLVGTSTRTNVVSGDDRSDTRRHAACPSGLYNNSIQKREPSARAFSTASNDHRLHESRVQQSNEEAHQPHAALSAFSADSPSSKTEDGNSGPVRSQHRKPVSGGSSTTGTTTGAYTGFTQNGQYDLTHDVILRGEFIPDQQAKVH